MSPAIRNARQHQAQLRKGIPTAEQVREQQETSLLIQEVMLIAEHLDRMLLSTPKYHVRSTVVWGVEIRLIRFTDVKYRLITEDNQIWRSITELATEAAEYAVYNGLVQ